VAGSQPTTQQNTKTSTNLDDSADDFSSLTTQSLRPDSQIELVDPDPVENINRNNSKAANDATNNTLADDIGNDGLRKRLSGIFEYNTDELDKKDESNQSKSPVICTSAPSSLPILSSLVSSTSFCPLCNKQAQAGHLKSCASKHGLTTQQVVELRRMEEKHREERRKLGIPDVALSVAAPKTSKARIPRKKTSDDAGADPDLALALALSISAAGTCNEDDGGKVEEVQGGKMSVRAMTEGQKMWLPQPTVTMKRKGKRIVGQTVLQSRSGVERERITGDRVARVLDQQMEIKELSKEERSPLGDWSHRNYGESSSHFWSLAGKLDTVTASQLIAEKMDNYLKLDRTFKVPSPSCPAQTMSLQPALPSQSPCLVSLSMQWLSLLKSGTASDLVILCKDEVEVSCHSLVLMVRCPNILKNVVKEGSGQSFVVMDQYEDTVVRVILTYLYGGSFDTQLITDKEQLTQLGKMVAEYKLEEFKAILGDVMIEEIDVDSIDAHSSEDNDEDKLICGTQGLDILLDCLDKDNKLGDVNDNADDDEWDEVCNLMTQSRSFVSEISNQDASFNKNAQTRREETINQKNASNEDIELDLRLEESFQSDSFHKLGEMRAESSIPAVQVSPYSVLPEVTKQSVLSRSFSPDMFDMSDDDDAAVVESAVSVTSSPSSSPTMTSMKRKMVSPPISPNKRFCSGPSLRTDEEHPSSVSQDDEIVDLTQPTPPNNHDDFEDEPPNNDDNEDEPPNKDYDNEDEPPNNDYDNEDEPPNNDYDNDRKNVTVPDFHDVSSISRVESLSPDPEPPYEVPHTDGPKYQNELCGSDAPTNNPPSEGILSTSAFEDVQSKLSSVSTQPNQSQSDISEKELLSLLTSLSTILEDKSSIPSLLVSALVKLATVPVTVPALLSTGVGKVVRRLKEKEGKVGRLAGKLVTRWKKLVMLYQPPPSDENIKNERIGETFDNVVVTASCGNNHAEPMNLKDNESEIIPSPPGESIDLRNKISNFRKSRTASVLEQTGLGSPCKEESFNYELPFREEIPCYEPISHYYSHVENIEDIEVELNLGQPVDSLEHSNKSFNASKSRTRVPTSVLEHSGLSSLISEKNDVHDVEGRIAACKEESFNYELPFLEEVPTQESKEYHSEARHADMVEDGHEYIDRDNVWDDFDEGAVSFGIEHDNFAIAECSDMWKTTNAPEMEEKENADPSPLRKSVSSPLPRPPQSVSAAVTPLPDYQTMMTPQLKAQLRKFGLKAMPRRKACLLLNHIYEQTHPLVPGTPLARQRGRPGPEPGTQEEGVEEESDSDLSQGSTSSQDRHFTDMPEESMMYEQEEEEEEYTPSQVCSGATLHSQLSSFLVSRPSLHASILQYQPLWLGELAKDVKEAGIKCKVAQLQDWLDIQCITFRTESSRNRNKVNKEQDGVGGKQRGRKKRIKETDDMVESSEAVKIRRPRKGK